RAAGHRARYLPARRRTVSDLPGGPAGAGPAPDWRGSVGRAVPEQGRPQGSVGPPLPVPEPGRGWPALRPLHARRRRRSRRHRQQPRCHQLGRRQRVSRQCRRGFTLIEMTVVLVVIAIGMTLAVPLIEGGFDSREVRRAARQIAATMVHCRVEAVSKAAPQELVINPERNLIATPDGGRGAVLRERAIIERVDGGAVLGDGAVQVLFYPNGSTSGADVVVASRRDRSRNRLRITLDPLVGTVRVQDAPAGGRTPGQAASRCSRAASRTP